MVEHG
jgi:hypothetical protein